MFPDTLTCNECDIDVAYYYDSEVSSYEALNILHMEFCI
jgi:hypothetical protein